MLERKTGSAHPLFFAQWVKVLSFAGQKSKRQIPKSIIINHLFAHSIQTVCSLLTLTNPEVSCVSFTGMLHKLLKRTCAARPRIQRKTRAISRRRFWTRFYGCGSPTTIAGVSEGETMVDLGAGAGIDCFIAAKRVGRNGKIYGIDMTDEMLKVANQNRSLVAEKLGYDIVEFRKGFLEDIPVDDKSVDIITSNCVINLSPDKKTVFDEMWRILKDHGRVVISDIVSEVETPPHLRANKQLWGECISGALTEDEFLAYLEQAGFYGLQVLQKLFWKEVEGYSFYSVTIRGYKFEKKEGCVYIGQKAIYHGPYKAIVDEEGHLFPRNEPVKICTDTAAKLSKPPYLGQFTVTNPDQENSVSYSCSTLEEGVSCC